jgi:hypothetical protein
MPEGQKRAQEQPTTELLRLNETDVREEVIAPLLRGLGYRSGTPNDIVRELTLRYPKLSLGRKNTKKDPLLRGKADYILVAQERVRWTLEAKAPSVELGIDEIEQAWTYAVHPEIRAVYYALCNGRDLRVYRTSDGPNSAALLSLKNSEFETKRHLISNVLSPDAIIAQFPSVEIDDGVPLAPGLRSFARITSGSITYSANSLGIGALNELQNTIRDGGVERDESGKMIAFISAIAPTQSMQKLNEKLGFSTFEMTSHASELSTDPTVPTIFRFSNSITLPKGERLLNILTWEHVTLPMPIVCSIDTEASGFCQDRIFSGRFKTLLNFSGQPIRLTGEFTISLV